MATETDLRTLLWQLSFQFKSHIKHAIRDYDIALNGMHVRLLHLLDAHPGSTANWLANESGRDKAQITRLINNLVARGLVEKQNNPTDRRSRFLQLTDKGDALIQQASRVEAVVEAQLLKGFSADEIAQFMALGQRMLANLNDS